jgi:hypothetical protein
VCELPLRINGLPKGCGVCEGEVFGEGTMCEGGGELLA